jgi:hypothetical protein
MKDVYSAVASLRQRGAAERSVERERFRLLEAGK